MEKLLKLSDIQVGFRFREDMGDLSELADSIRATKGLQFNWIVVEKIEDTYHLRAGGRRFKTYELLSSGSPEVWKEYEPTQEDMDRYSSIPCTILQDLTPEDRLRIEFIENRARKDFTWQEAAPLVKEFHTNQQKKFGVPTGGQGKSGWSIRDTAEDLGLLPSQVIEYLKLADGLSSSSKLGDVRQKSKALVKLKRQKSIELADLLEIENYTHKDIRIVCADSRDYLNTIEDESVDLIITDPPWGIDFEERTADARTDAYVSYDNKHDPLTNLEVLSLAYKKLRPNCPIYMFWSAFIPKMVEGKELLEAVGFTLEVIPLIWYKKHVLTHDARETRHMINYEIIFYGWKGERPFLNHPSRNVFEHQVAYQNRIHSAEKSESLLAELIELHAQQGDMILDPFGGSCKIADACKRLLRKCLVIEQDQDLTKMASLRLEGI